MNATSTQTRVHEYFVYKAREAFAAAGGDPDLSGNLAAWAHAAREVGDSRRGVIVSDLGEILAETRYCPGRVGATYAVTGGPDVANRELGMAVAHLRRQTGRDVAHVKYGDVCQGAGRLAGRTAQS